MSPEIELDFAVPLKDVTVPEKRQARFECALTREANVIWSKGPDIIKAGDKFDIISDGKKHILVINDSAFDDEGEYTAEVEGKKTTAKLTVEGKSELKVEMRKLWKIIFYESPKINDIIIALTLIRVSVIGKIKILHLTIIILECLKSAVDIYMVKK